jgi:hypothetical protein
MEVSWMIRVFVSLAPGRRSDEAVEMNSGSAMATIRQVMKAGEKATVPNEEEQATGSAPA